jgi:small nuclear ribonucleoprotein B and B'
MMAFDKHMNVVLSEADEFRFVKGRHGEPDKEQKRAMGMMLIRGDNVVNLNAEAAPT